MKKILIVLLLLPWLSFSKDYIFEYNKNIEKEKEITKLFNAIKTKNNIYAKMLLGKKQEENSKSYNIPWDIEKDENIDPNIKDVQGYTPVIIACMYDNLEILEFLIKQGANLNCSHPILGKTMLATAIAYNSTKVAIYLITHHKEMINQASQSDGWLAIEEAVLKENKEVLLELLKNGADIRKKDKRGNNAYDLATRHGKGAIVKILRDYELSKSK